MLTVGDPDQSPPAPVIEATIEALRRHRTGYSAIVGYPRVRQAIAARFQRRTGQPVQRRECRRHARRPGRHLLRSAMPCRPRRRGDRARADLQHLRCGNRRERRAPGDRAVAGRTGLSPRPRRDRRRSHAAHPRDLDQQPAQPDRVSCSRRRRSPASPSSARPAICGSSRTRSTKTLPSPGRMSARGRCPVWRSAPSSYRACRNRMRCPAFALAGSSVRLTLSQHLFNLLLCMIYGSPAFIQDGVLRGARDRAA